MGPPERSINGTRLGRAQASGLGPTWRPPQRAVVARCHEDPWTAFGVNSSQQSTDCGIATVQLRVPLSSNLVFPMNPHSANPYEPPHAGGHSGVPSEDPGSSHGSLLITALGTAIGALTGYMSLPIQYAQRLDQAAKGSRTVCPKATSACWPGCVPRTRHVGPRLYDIASACFVLGVAPKLEDLIDR